MGIDAKRRVQLGRIVAAHGVQGWVKVESWTRPAQNLLDYPEWQLEGTGSWRKARLVTGRRQGKGLVVQLADEAGVVIADRDAAQALAGSRIAVLRGQMPEAAPDEFYWADLEGLSVEDQEGRKLGQVRELFETPAHDMLVVVGEQERLIPFVRGPIVKSVDLQAGLIRVDWVDPAD